MADPSADQGMKNCCNRRLEEFLRGQQLISEESKNPWSSGYLKTMLKEFAPLIWDCLECVGTLVAVNSNDQPNAWLRPVTCLECQQRFFVVFVRASMLHLTWRVQTILSSLIVDWHVTERNGEFHTRVKSRDPVSSDIKQLKIGLEMYFGATSISDAGMDELMAAHYSCPEDARIIFTNAVGVGHLWIICHELGHSLSSLLAEDQASGTPWACLLGAVRSHARDLAKSLELRYKFSKSWAEELEADVLATDLLLRAMLEVAEQRKLTDPVIAGRDLAAGISAAFEAMKYINYRQWLSSPGLRDIRENSHPPLAARWDVVSQCLEQFLKPANRTQLFWKTELLQQLGADLFEAYQTESKSGT